MILIPAIDIQDGRCVRLRQGVLQEATVYSEDPLSVAQRWQAEDARRLHVVDLNGAVAGYPVHFDRICEMLKTVPLPIQIGGGIRTLEQVANYMAAGAAGVILGTSILHDASLVQEAVKQFPGKIIAGIDCKQGRVASRGWVTLSDQTPADLALRIQAMGVSGMILTDIEKDGMLKGPNLDFFREMAQVIRIPWVASGGVTTKDDLLKLSALPGISGAIVGKALYSGALSYGDAARVLEEGHAG